MFMLLVFGFGGSFGGGCFGALLQVKHPAERVQQRGNPGISSGRLEPRYRRVEDLVYDAAAEGIEGLFLLRRKFTQAAAYAIELGLANGLEVILQRDDDGHDMETLQAGLEALNLGLDNLFGVLGFLLATGDVRGDSVLEVVNVINEDAIELVHGRINVARDGDINEEHRSVLALGEKFFAVFAAEDRDWRSGGCDDDVGLLAMLVEAVETDGVPAETRSELASALVGAIGDEDRSSTASLQMARGQFGHFAGTHQANLFAFE